MSLDFLGLETPNEHRLAWDNKDWDKVKELCNEFKVDKDKSLFEIIKNVTQKTGYKNVREFADYDQFMINLMISQHAHMVGYASELNQWAGCITDQMHYDYLYHTVVKCQLPFMKAAKASNDWDYILIVKLLARHYSVSDSKAKDFIELHDETQLRAIKKLYKGIVTSPDCDFLKFAPNKTERTRLYGVVKKW
ncbi:DNA polymerase accessory protein [Aeromonas phage AP1]|nr:DNA polymerase accessory protein [Aeromonas phage AP1]